MTAIPQTQPQPFTAAQAIASSFLAWTRWSRR